MEKLPRMKDMAVSLSKRNEGALVGIGAINTPIYPYGLQISLTNDELEKLGLDSDCGVGDMLHMHCLAKVTSVSKRETEGGEDCCIQLQITHISAEDEDAENEDSEEDNAETSGYGG